MDLARIELAFRQCECRVVPLDHRPKTTITIIKKKYFNNMIIQKYTSFIRGVLYKIKNQKTLHNDNTDNLHTSILILLQELHHDIYISR